LGLPPVTRSDGSLPSTGVASGESATTIWGTVVAVARYTHRDKLKCSPPEDRKNNRIQIGWKALFDADGIVTSRQFGHVNSSDRCGCAPSSGRMCIFCGSVRGPPSFRSALEIWRDVRKGLIHLTNEDGLIDVGWCSIAGMSDDHNAVPFSDEEFPPPTNVPASVVPESTLPVSVEPESTIPVSSVPVSSVPVSGISSVRAPSVVDWSGFEASGGEAGGGCEVDSDDDDIDAFDDDPFGVVVFDLPKEVISQIAFQRNAESGCGCSVRVRGLWNRREVKIKATYEWTFPSELDRLDASHWSDQLSKLDSHETLHRYESFGVSPPTESSHGRLFTDLPENASPLSRAKNFIEYYLSAVLGAATFHSASGRIWRSLLRSPKPPTHRDALLLRGTAHSRYNLYHEAYSYYCVQKGRLRRFLSFEDDEERSFPILTCSVADSPPQSLHCSSTHPNTKHQNSTHQNTKHQNSTHPKHQNTTHPNSKHRGSTQVDECDWVAELLRLKNFIHEETEQPYGRAGVDITDYKCHNTSIHTQSLHSWQSIDTIGHLRQDSSPRTATSSCFEGFTSDIVNHMAVMGYVPRNSCVLHFYCIGEIRNEVNNALPTVPKFGTDGLPAALLHIAVNVEFFVQPPPATPPVSERSFCLNNPCMTLRHALSGAVLFNNFFRCTSSGASDVTSLSSSATTCRPTVVRLSQLTEVEVLAAGCENTERPELLFQSLQGWFGRLLDVLLGGTHENSPDQTNNNL